MKTTLNVISIGRAARQLGVTAAVVRLVAEELGVVPALVVDDLEFFTRADVLRFRCRIAGEAAADEPETAVGEL